MPADSNTFRFLHCADLHLDSPFQGLGAVAPQVAEVLREATFQAFENVIDLAVERRVDFIVIAGDVYDGADRSLRAQLKFRDALDRAAERGIRSFVAHGNHDPLDGWEANLPMPTLVHRFGGEVEQVPVVRDGREIARVYGISFPTRDVRENLARRFRRDREAPFAVAVMHANVGGNPAFENYAPCSLADLADSGIDYWALGHVHARGDVSPARPLAVYPGNTQGRSIRETGPRGCYVVEVDGGNVRREFVATDVVRWFAEPVDVAGLENEGQLIERLEETREEVRHRAEGRAAVVRLRVEGRGELHARLRRVDPERDLAERLRDRESARRDFVWIESIELATRPAADLAHRRQLPGFVGEFLRAAQALRDADDPAGETRALLEARPEHRLVAGAVAEFDTQVLAEILAEAEMLGLEHLLDDET
jgi:exonuclease SbcD